jgi:Kef-type K+ transport system membrane component KefB
VNGKALGAHVGGHFVELFGRPAVLGELLPGVVLGNLSLMVIVTTLPTPPLLKWWLSRADRHAGEAALP